jgi:hypothetical protein
MALQNQQVDQSVTSSRSDAVAEQQLYCCCCCQVLHEHVEPEHVPGGRLRSERLSKSPTSAVRRPVPDMLRYRAAMPRVSAALTRPRITQWRWPSGESPANMHTRITMDRPSWCVHLHPQATSTSNIHKQHPQAKYALQAETHQLIQAQDCADQPIHAQDFVHQSIA